MVKALTKDTPIPTNAMQIAQANTILVHLGQDRMAANVIQNRPTFGDPSHPMTLIPSAERLIRPSCSSFFSVRVTTSRAVPNSWASLA